ncbi:hypothetical protein LZG04_34420 [Saccharothrix sp. S26]|uniref:hypothetical protein n=1 Tax=Saccharothrix sp. S26 TaxID=2907215 RepID=UPI001F3107B6|nr:hypothetical protein [Saccharothrix sp. S26]MCE6999872.1 hypothetical protein [Saccharothrix sp. S26]
MSEPKRAAHLTPPAKRPDTPEWASATVKDGERLAHVAEVGRVERLPGGPGTGHEPGLMSSQRAAELAALLTRAAELAARIGGGR